VNPPPPSTILIWPDGTHDPALPELPGEVIVAAWHPDAADGGRTQLLQSLRRARDRVAEQGGDPDSLALVGFGRGAVAAAGLTRYAKRLGIGLGHVVCVAANWDEPDPFSGGLLAKVPKRVELVEHAGDVPAVITWTRPR